MYPRYGLLLVFAYHVATGLSLPTTTYDQRQTGDLNVQVHLKDVQVVALLDPEMLDDYTEYDYFYDYADFTLKPIVKPTTSTTTTTTETVPSEQINVSETSDSSTQNSTFPSIGQTNANSTMENAEILPPADAEKTNETLASSSTESLENSTSDGGVLRTRSSDKITNLFEDKKENPTERGNWGSSTENPSKRLSRKRCKLGYSPDGKGRCRRLSQRKLSLIPLTMRLPSKLLDDLRRNTRNLAQEEDDRMHLN